MRDHEATDLKEDPATIRVVGRYALYEKIASGGMATVFLGRLLGPVGFARTVAVKRLHPQYASDPEFVAMFLDEARVAARIRHPNVVPTLDVVAAKGELFLVMEYVHGESLSKLVQIVAKQHQWIPVPIAVSILSGTLQGLEAAHGAKSERGVPLEIVHRDVSPQNILLGHDGQARLIDFGVARAIGRSQTTRQGQIKGKVAYMPPEQVRGQELGPATDVYAAGVVLWEILAGRRLFRGENDAALMSQVVGAHVLSPSEALLQAGNEARAREVAPLDDAVMRALARATGDRLQTAGEFARLLEATVPPASSANVSDWVQRVAGSTLRERATIVANIERNTPGAPEAMGVLISPDSLQSAPDVARARGASREPSLREPPFDGTLGTLVMKQFAPDENRSEVLPLPEQGGVPSVVTVRDRPTASTAPARPPLVARRMLAFIIGATTIAVLATLALALRTPHTETASKSPPAETGLAAIPIQADPPTRSPASIVSTILPPSTAIAEPQSAKASQAPSEREAPPAPVRPPKTHPRAMTGCNPPYTYDANGVKHYKDECF